MKLNFEWDEKKAKSNRKKHGIGFDEAATVFLDPLSMTIPDHNHSAEEQSSDILISAVPKKDVFRSLFILTGAGISVSSAAARQHIQRGSIMKNPDKKKKKEGYA